MAERKTIVYPNPEVLAQAVAARTLLTIIDLLAEPDRQRVDIAVTGGTDGIYVLKVMGESPLADAVDWRRVHVWWGDERFVAADDDDRNAKQAREAWFGKLIEDGLMPAGNIHEMPNVRSRNGEESVRIRGGGWKQQGDGCRAGGRCRGIPAGACRAVGQRASA